MISVVVCIVALIVGYKVYGRLAEKIFAPDGRETPAIANADGVDFVPIKTKKALLVQLLNIAGTGPIFGAIAGAVFGPIVFIWIVLGAILGGAVHDYMVGMISTRNNGASFAELSGKYMGLTVKVALRTFSVVLLVLVGTVFITSPAGLLEMLTPNFMSYAFWIILIFIYYIIATLFPIDKIIGKLYPIFGVVLLIMAAGIFIALSVGGYTISEINFTNMNESLPVFPFMFITVACGAISGFHATQSPLMAKCITSEYDGKKVFYGAMIIEAVIALVWASAGVAFYENSALLSEAIATYGQSTVVYNISISLLGGFGGALAIIGVVICPISSGDTAFRSARLIIAETFNIEQSKIKNRLIITLPLLALGGLLTTINFDVLWRYFSWSNQTLAMIVLWCCSIYLIKHNKGYLKSLITALPAMFMTAVSSCYILMADEGFGLSATIGYGISIPLAIAAFAAYTIWTVCYIKNHPPTQEEYLLCEQN